MPMRNQESEIGFLGATAGLSSSALYHLFERALVLDQISYVYGLEFREKTVDLLRLLN